MAERAHLDWFRERIARSRGIEPSDPAPLLAWLERQRSTIQFRAELIGLDEVRGWSRDDKGNVRHQTGQFFAIEGVRIESGDLREVASWDQPILYPARGRHPRFAGARDGG
jgi:oxidase EvaA